MKGIEWRDSLTRWTRGNRIASALIIDLWRIAEIWDDLVDKDKDISEAEINSAFFAALISIPRNQFYQAHFVTLNPLIEAAIIDWQTANILEKNMSDQSLRQSYVLRCSLMKVITAIAGIIGSVELAVTVNTEISLLGDTWEEYTHKHGVS